MTVFWINSIYSVRDIETTLWYPWGGTFAWGSLKSEWYILIVSLYTIHYILYTIYYTLYTIHLERSEVIKMIILWLFSFWLAKPDLSDERNSHRVGTSPFQSDRRICGYMVPWCLQTPLHFGSFNMFHYVFVKINIRVWEIQHET